MTQFLLLFLISLLVLVSLLMILYQYGDPRRLLGAVITPVFRFLVSLRYRVDVYGLQNIAKGQGYIFLPNHPAEVDPLIVMTCLYRDFRPRPFVLEKFYDMPGLNSLMKFTRALAVPDTDDGAGSFKLRRIEKVLDECAQDIHAGESFLFYPAGRLMRGPCEDLRGASGLHSLLQRNPDLPLVLVRTSGLWGSRFSTALSAGVTPDMGSVLLECIRDLFVNLLFFTPRRRVTVEFILPDSSMPRQADKATLNQWMNQTLNAKETESLSLVPRFFFASTLPEQKPKQAPVAEPDNLDPEIQKKVLAEVAKRCNRNVSEISVGMSLAEDLGMDSLDRAEFLGYLDEEFQQSDVEVTEITSVLSLILLASGTRTQTVVSSRTPKAWLETRPQPLVPAAQTLQECFLLSCERMGQSAAVGDEISGVLTYQRLKIGALALAEVIRQLPGERIGLLMPASAGADVLIFATLLAGKVPVMVNWTLGAANLQSVLETAAMDQVLTSRRFLDRAGDIQLGDMEERLIYLEDIRQNQINWVIKLKAFWDSRKSTQSLIQQLALDRIQADSPAVILFTSGSESVPKGVPLSHSNILENIRNALKTMRIHSNDVFFGFLPPFHSFGFTVTSILPVITGLRCAYHPNPTDSRRLAAGVEKWQISLMCGTPSFLRGILKALPAGQGQSLRYLLSGAEKADDELFKRVEGLGVGAVLLEGYGITECSPIITVNRENTDRAGVGLPLDGTEIIIVDPESLKLLPNESQGLILVQGPSVFAGYLNSSKNPFVELNGKKFYNTGDLGYLSSSGSLYLSGRMKRFVKIAGEMISLPALETALTDLFPVSEEGPTYAVEALEKDGERPVIALFCGTEIELETVNTHLRAKGMGAVAKISRIIPLKAIPLLGTGKTDYRSLKAMIEN